MFCLTIPFLRYLLVFTAAPKSSAQKFSFADIKSTLVKKEKSTETPVHKPAHIPVTRSTKKKRGLEAAINLESYEDVSLDDSKDRVLLGVHHIVQLAKQNADELAAATEKCQDLQKIAVQKDAHFKRQEELWKKECEATMEDAKACARNTVVEAMYEIAKEAASEGYLHSSWDIKGWADMLEKPEIKVQGTQTGVEAGAGEAGAGEAAGGGMGDDGGANA